MGVSGTRRWLSVIFFLSGLIIPFVTIFHISAHGSEASGTGVAENNPPQKLAIIKPRIEGNELFLVRGERIRHGSTSLVFKGIENKKILVDLYLEELDPDHAYPQQFPLTSGEHPVRLGDLYCRVASVKRSALTLEIVQAMNTF